MSQIWEVSTSNCQTFVLASCNAVLNFGEKVVDFSCYLKLSSKKKNVYFCCFYTEKLVLIFVNYLPLHPTEFRHLLWLLAGDSSDACCREQTLSRLHIPLLVSWGPKPVTDQLDSNPIMVAKARLIFFYYLYFFSFIFCVFSVLLITHKREYGTKFQDAGWMCLGLI